ncbi:MAG: GlsB/YeaQ/YmgE family stress response membrane protein [Ornithinimicrobium sp.]
MTTSGIFTALLAGIVIGALGRLIIPGRQAIGWILTFVVGLVGAFVGGFLAEGMDLTIWWQVLVFQVLVAAVLVLLVNGLVRGQVTKRRRTDS